MISGFEFHTKIGFCPIYVSYCRYHYFWNYTGCSGISHDIIVTNGVIIKTNYMTEFMQVNVKLIIEQIWIRIDDNYGITMPSVDAILING
jgi:hypothetical protein